MCKEKKVLNNGNLYCPICDSEFETSDYLSTIFATDIGALWFANMVTHYRHNHITYWNKCWGDHGNYYRRNWFGDYESEKMNVNERAKRQIVRKCKDYIREMGFNKSSFLSLKGNDEKTKELIEKTFEKIKQEWV